MHYLGPQDFEEVFNLVYKYYSKIELAPDYFAEKTGLEKLRGVTEGVKMDQFYPDIYSKAAYLLIQINKGHFFSNGNKRLALIFVLAFILINKRKIRKRSKKQHESKLRALFPKFQIFQDYQNFLPEEFGYYNLSIIVADSEKYMDSFENLKIKVKEFFKFSVA
ncbi:hypothetical protein A3A21_01920 [Candidatus Jorgensenbacteria bacterium RIFCSPLOWO2_01_FULL_45_25b]|uniref:Fido domain-containing protein n=1 Tax=Candidatus Jorgensenbacteria bacterium RIFCSPLOWO2_01_FULL_45_25b TaxID=1798471 RepID=A0A1F6BUY7_9BACT|nr:MAG: hypothetical protein A3A21_01920 [Candidatus Jorgensenbacteria bacterium RIFCSPLOWO2_01_FULL_45_25b]